MQIRKLLQSKSAVACLVVIAVACVAGQFVDFPKKGAFKVLARSTESAPPAPEDPENFIVPAEIRIASDLSDWLNRTPIADVARDPFALPASSRTRVAPAPPTSSPGMAPIAPTFSVSAISLDDVRAFAVINHQIVGVHDHIGTYEVAQIRAGEVLLQGPSGQIVVSLRRPDAAPRKAVPANISPATPANGDPRP